MRSQNKHFHITPKVWELLKCLCDSVYQKKTQLRMAGFWFFSAVGVFFCCWERLPTKNWTEVIKYAIIKLEPYQDDICFLKVFIERSTFANYRNLNKKGYYPIFKILVQSLNAQEACVFKIMELGYAVN